MHSPIVALKSIHHNRALLKQFVYRDVTAKYRGSFFGILWTLIVPLVMLLVYSVVFTVVFKARFPEVGTGADGEFAIILFSGLILHNLFSDCLMASTTLITGNANLVKKVIFPLEILSPAMVLGVLVQFCISFIVLLAGCLFIYGTIHWTIILVPLIILPYIIMIMGVVWFFASLGVFIRDVTHMMSILSTILLFMSTIFFPASRLPESFQWAIYINPISSVVDQFRAVVIRGEFPDWQTLGLYTIISLVIFTVGYWWFSKTRNGFADVL